MPIYILGVVTISAQFCSCTAGFVIALLITWIYRVNFIMKNEKQGFCKTLFFYEMVEEKHLAVWQKVTCWNALEPRQGLVRYQREKWPVWFGPVLNSFHFGDFLPAMFSSSNCQRTAHVYLAYYSIILPCLKNIEIPLIFFKVKDQPWCCKYLCTNKGGKRTSMKC